MAWKNRRFSGLLQFSCANETLELSFESAGPLKVQAFLTAAKSETGWDLGPLAAVLAPDTHLLEQQNTKKLKGTKNNCPHEQLGQIMDKKIQKAQMPLLKSREQRQGVGSKSRVLCMPPAHNITKGVGRPPKPPLQSDPRTILYPHPTQGTSSSPLGSE